jgi:glycosyltransferase 2 family protein
VKKLLRPACSLVILGVLASWMDWQKVADAFAHLHWGLWLLGVLLYVLTQVVSSLRWQWLSRPLGFERPLGHYFAFYFIGMFFNLMLPTSVGGDVVRAWYLDGGSGHRMTAFVSVLIDRATGLLILLLVACLGVVVCPIGLPWWVPASVWGMAAAAFLGLLSLPFVARWTARFDRFRRLAQGARFYLRHPRLLLETGGLSLGIQAANVLLVWLVGLAIDVRISPLYYCVFVPMVCLLTLLPISLNGMGIREWSTVLFLAPLGVNASTATSLAFLWFLMLTAVSLCGGIIYLFGCYAKPDIQGQPEYLQDEIPPERPGSVPAAQSLTAVAS